MGDQEHFLLFPFFAQGHLAPFLSLAELIERRRPSATITLVSTPLNVQSLRPSLSPTSAIRLRGLPLPPADYGLPAGAETTDVLPFHLFINLFQASEALRPSFERLLLAITDEDGQPPLCIVADPFFGWTVDIAKGLNIFHTLYITAGAYGTAVYNSLWQHLPHTLTDAEEFPLPDFPDIIVRRSGLPKHLLAANGADNWSVFLRSQISLCSQSDAAIINTVEELEKTGLAMLRKSMDLPLYPIGPLFGTPSTRGDRSCIQWLESQAPSSVLYISFGSQNTITETQMRELATGLESSGRPFVWVIRPPVGFDIKTEFRPEWLPEGFEERMASTRKGIMLHGWAPQREILAHASTSAFLSHCGWNSVLESLSQGVPIIAWPLTADQLYNATMLEKEVGVCVEVARGNKETSRVESEQVERVVRLVMGEKDEGRAMRTRAGEVAEMLRAAWKEVEEGKAVGSSSRGLANFFQVVLAKRIALS